MSILEPSRATTAAGRRRSGLARRRADRGGARLPRATCRAWAARRRPACCSSRSAATTCRWTPTCTGWAPGSACSGRGPRSRRRTTRCCGSRPRATPTRCTCCSSATAGAPARRARPRCGECPLRRMCPRAGAGSAGGMTPALASACSPAAVLAVPFLVAIAALQGLTVEIDTFHGTDAGLYHLPTIMQFADHVDLELLPGGADAALPPALRRLREGRGLRALEAAAAERGDLVRRRARAAPAAPPGHAARAAAGAGAHARVHALAVLLRRLLHAAHRQPGAAVRLPRARADRGVPPVARRSAPLALACLALCARPCSRASPSSGSRAVAGWFLFAAPVAGRAEARRPRAGRARRWRRWPALVVAWDGLVPKGSDPGSCGLCGDQPGGEGLTLRPVGFTLALLGAYAAVLYGPGAAPARRARLPAAVAVLAGARRGRGGRRCCLARVAAHLRAERARAARATAAGCGRWRTASPRWRARRSLFFVLVPAGLLALCLLVRRAGRRVAARGGRSPRSCWPRCPCGSSTRSTSTRWRSVTLALLARPPDLRQALPTTRAWPCSALAFVAYAAQLQRRLISSIATQVHHEDQRLVRADRALALRP